MVFKGCFVYGMLSDFYTHFWWWPPIQAWVFGSVLLSVMKIWHWCDWAHGMSHFIQLFWAQSYDFSRMYSNIEIETGIGVLKGRQKRTKWIYSLESPEATWSFWRENLEDEDKGIVVLFCFCSVSVCLRRKHDGKGLQKNWEMQIMGLGRRAWKQENFLCSHEELCSNPQPSLRRCA